MYRAIPIVNKSVYKHTQERNDKIHAIKVLCANTQIDFSEPYKYKHLESKLKRERILEGIYIIYDRCTEIEKSNRMLLENIKNISKRNGTQSKSVPHKRTLNLSSRKRNIEKICKDNLWLLNRLKKQNSNYNVTNWQHQEMKRIELLKNICEYPYKVNANILKSRQARSFVMNLLEQL